MYYHIHKDVPGSYTSAGTILEENNVFLVLLFGHLHLFSYLVPFPGTRQIPYYLLVASLRFLRRMDELFPCPFTYDFPKTCLQYSYIM